MINRKTNKPVNNRVRECRERLRWSQDRLAKEASTTTHTIHNIEYGINEPRGSTKLRIAEALGVSVDIVFPLESDEEESAEASASLSAA